MNDVIPPPLAAGEANADVGADALPIIGLPYIDVASLLRCFASVNL
jgi:hypothetical protein